MWCGVVWCGVGGGVHYIMGEGVPMIGAVNPIERICLVAVGPSIFGIIKSIKITSNDEEEEEEGRGRLGPAPVTPPPPAAIVVVTVALAAAAARLSLIFSTATAPFAASSHV